MKTLIFLSWIFFSQNIWAQYTTNDFNVIYKKAMDSLEFYAPEDILLVFDIDNTLLKMTQNLGSDQWFNWQYYSCLKGKQPSFCVADSMQKLLQIQEYLFALAPMLPSQPEMPKLIQKLQARGMKVIALTSRGPEFRSSTERELNNNGYRFHNSSMHPGFPGTFIPYTIKNYKSYGLNKYDVRVAKLKSGGRAISFMNGVMMTAGLNKGIMLKTLLHKTKYQPKLILFADDHSKHTIRMQRIISPIAGTQVLSYRYSKMDPVVEAFNSGNKQKVIRQYKTLSRALSKVFP